MLVVLPTWVGDFVMATPTLRVIRRRFADAHITFLMEPNLSELVRGGDWMDECIAWPPKTHRSVLHREYRALTTELRQRRFDWAVLLPNSFRSAFLAWWIGARRRIGYHRDGRGWLLTDRIPVKNRKPGWWRKTNGEWRMANGDLPICAASANPCARSEAASYGPAIGNRQSAIGNPGASGFPIRPGPSVRVRMGHRLPRRLGPFVPMPMVEYYADLAEAIGCPRPDDRLELFTTPDADAAIQRRLASAGLGSRRPLVIVSPGAKFGASKCWPPERFAALCDRLMENQQAAMVITCGPGEEPIARAIATSARNKPMVFDDPRLSLGELKSLIARGDLLIGNDAGPRHIAKAFNVPVVTIFGPTHPTWTATSFPDEWIARVDVDCGPCQQRDCPPGHHRCMTEVSVAAAYEASRQLLHSRAERFGATFAHEPILPAIR